MPRIISSQAVRGPCLQFSSIYHTHCGIDRLPDGGADSELLFCKACLSIRIFADCQEVIRPFLRIPPRELVRIHDW